MSYISKLHVVYIHYIIYIYTEHIEYFGQGQTRSLFLQSQNGVSHCVTIAIDTIPNFQITFARLVTSRFWSRLLSNPVDNVNAALMQRIEILSPSPKAIPTSPQKPLPPAIWPGSFGWEQLKPV